MNYKKLLIIASTSVLVLAGLTGTYFLGKHVSRTQQKTSQSSSSNYPLLAKRLFVESPNDQILNFAPLRTELNAYMNAIGKQNSVYFEYLPSGTSIKVGDTNELVAASLTKIPVVMQLYKAKELGKLNLDDMVPLKQEFLDSASGDLYKMGAGYQLSLRQAAQKTLEDSDNTAALTIIDATQTKVSSSDAPYSALDLQIERDKNNQIVIDSKSYSSFLKCLYFSCYLNNDDSQEVLDYLSSSKFNDRLTAPIPNDIKVAHKIGTFSTKIQSDCGIIYLPNRQYLLCVMLAMPDPEASKNIANISKITYDYVLNYPNSANPKP